MLNPVTDDELDRLLGFIGYGTLDASVWFIGMEEAGAGHDALRIRSGFQPVEDCAEAHRKLGIMKHHWGPRTIQRTWRGMCHVMLTLDGVPPTRETIRVYQAEKLGRREGTTLLAELMPLPRPLASGWEYAGILPQFRDADHYLRAVLPLRISLLRETIQRHKPAFIVCYGKRYWREFEALLDGAPFANHGPFRVGSNANTSMVLTSHFISRAMNGRFNEVAAVLRKERERRESN